MSLKKSKSRLTSAGSRISNERRPILALLVLSPKGFALRHSGAMLSPKYWPLRINDSFNLPETSGVFEVNSDDALVATEGCKRCQKTRMKAFHLSRHVVSPVPGILPS